MSPSVHPARPVFPDQISLPDQKALPDEKALPDQVAPAGQVGSALTVRGRRRLAENVVGLDLADPAGGLLPRWSPGAHVDVTVRPGMVRQYSLCGDPADRARWRIAVLREAAGRGGSTHLHDRVGVGSTLAVGPPRNAFPLVPARRYLLIAGGIGITPLLPMAAELAARGADWRLLYGGRRRVTMAFTEELAAFGDRVVLHPEDSHGPLPLGPALDGLRAAGPPEEAAVYCCGPEGLLNAVERACAGWPAEALHVERFRPAVAAHQDADRGFEVEAARSGRVVRVDAGRSILAALEAAGLGVTSSCRDGTCGTCETRVVAGTVDHRDTVLTPDERELGQTMMICVSRSSAERLVLDI